MARALGLDQGEVPDMLDWYDGIVAAVTEITAGREPPARGAAAAEALSRRLRTTITKDSASVLAAAAADSGLTDAEVVSNGAILLFGGIETTEGMITNALLHLLEHPEALTEARGDPAYLDAAIEESLRLEPAAAVVDRYATADTDLARAHINQGDLVRVSISAANRDPAAFPDPDLFDPSRPRQKGQLAFAQGPHVCLGVHLARLEARTGLATILDRLPTLRSDPDRPARIEGLVFRKPSALRAKWAPA
jgi:cytochrome P450